MNPSTHTLHMMIVEGVRAEACNNGEVEARHRHAMRQIATVYCLFCCDFTDAKAQLAGAVQEEIDYATTQAERIMQTDQWRHWHRWRPGDPLLTVPEAK